MPFLVAYSSTFLPSFVCLFISRNIAMGEYLLKGYWVVLLLSSYRAFARCVNLLLVRTCRTESVYVRNTVIVLFWFWVNSNRDGNYQCLWRCFAVAVVSSCCCTGCLFAAVREVNVNTSTTILKYISCGAMCVDTRPSFLWILFTYHG